MPRFAANLSMLFTEQDFLARFEAAAKAGFSGVEYLFPYDFSSAEIKAKLDANGLTQVLFNLPAGDWAKGERGIACLPDRVEEFRAGVDLAIAYAQVLGNTQVNCLAGIRPQGFDDATVEKTFVANLKYAADKLQAAGIKLVMEAINTRDIPGFYLNNTAQALSIREQVGSNTTSTTCKSWKATWPAPCNRTWARSTMCSSRTTRDATNQAPVKSTTASCSNTWTASGIRAGSVANTSR
jgi:hydroxypyruvate isomerase